MQFTVRRSRVIGSFESAGGIIAPSAGVDLARSFDGSSDSASIAMDLSGFNRASVSFWLWWTGFANNDQLAMEYSTNYNLNIGSFIVDPNDAGGAFRIGWHTTGTGTAEVYADISRPSAQAWHHYLFEIDGTQTTAPTALPAIYVDGMAQSPTYTISGTITAANFGNLVLYLMSRAGSSLFGGGRMADFAVWGGKLLSAGNASTLAAGARANAVLPGSLTVWIPIVGQSPEPDKSGNGNNATLTGTAVVAGPPQLAPF